jgi:hypothetical protein
MTNTTMNVEWTITDLFAVLARRRAWIFSALILSCAIALLYAFTDTPRYRATAVIEMQKGSHGAFGLDNTTSDSQATTISDSFDDNLTLQTEIGILQSDAGPRRHPSRRPRSHPRLLRAPTQPFSLDAQPLLLAESARASNHPAGRCAQPPLRRPENLCETHKNRSRRRYPPHLR